MSKEAKTFLYELFTYPIGVTYTLYKDKGFGPVLFILAFVTIVGTAVVGMISENL